jgi:hypothetical protein
MEFSPEQIKNFLEKVIADEAPVLNNLIDITLFVSKVSKNLIATLNSDTISNTDKINATISMGETIVNELETKGHITLELAQSFRETLKNGKSITDLLSSFSDFTETINKVIPAEIVNDKKIGPWVKLFQTCLTSFSCTKTTAASPKLEPIVPESS